MLVLALSFTLSSSVLSSPTNALESSFDAANKAGGITDMWTAPTT